MLSILATAVACAASGAADSHDLVARLRPGWTVDAASRLLEPRGSLAECGVARLAPVFAERPLRRGGAARLQRWVALELADGADARVVRRALSQLDLVFEVVEEPGLVEAAGDADPPLPDDPYFGLQYGLHNTGQTVAGFTGIADADCDAPEAWEIAAPFLPLSPVTIGIVDTGVHPHPEYADRMLAGKNTYDGSSDTSDLCSSHGTHVTGIAAAASGNAVGVASLGAHASILPVKAFGTSCFANWTSLSTGAVWAVDHGASVINMSVHGYEYSALMEDAVNYAFANDVLIVASAGNGNAQVAYPAKYANAMAIASSNNLDVKSSSSNPGPELDVAAAGSSIWSTVKPDGYGFKGGTSMAAPQVTGLAAFLKGINPYASAAGLWSVIISTADDIEAPGFDEKSGWGRINAAEAVTELLARAADGDVDADGGTGARDLAIVLGAWGTGGFADLTGDGTTDAADVAFVLERWTG
jgi:subtilisin family serine protease